MFALMNMAVDGLFLVAPDCGSWGLPARGSSLRSLINPLGRRSLAWVEANNCTVSRRIVCIRRGSLCIADCADDENISGVYCWCY